MPSVNKYTRWSGVWSTTEAAQAKASGKWPQSFSNFSTFSWGGGNTYGELGIGSIATTRSSPVQLGSSRWAQLSCGFRHAAGIQADGTLWTWGANDYGQLGLGTTNNYSYPKQVGGSSNWKKVVCSYSATIGLKTDGTLWNWGSGDASGLNETVHRSSPVQVGVLTTWTDIGASIVSGHGVRSDGTLWSWGLSTWGNLGNGGLNPVSSPVQVGSGIGSDWVSVAASGYHVCAMRSNGMIYAWGRSGYGQIGQLGNSDQILRIGTDSDWTSISGGLWHTAAIKSNGTLWQLGRNSNGQFGNNGTSTLNTSPVQTGSDTNWSKCECGNEYTMAIKTTGTLYAIGSNTNGKLGDGTAISRSSPVQIGARTDWVAIRPSLYSNSVTLGGVSG